MTADRARRPAETEVSHRGHRDRDHHLTLCCVLCALCVKSFSFFQRTHEHLRLTKWASLVSTKSVLRCNESRSRADLLELCAFRACLNCRHKLLVNCVRAAVHTSTVGLAHRHVCVCERLAAL